MTAVELNETVLADLGAGNSVAPRELLKARLAELLAALERHDKGEGQPPLGHAPQTDNMIAGLADELDGLVAVAFPLIEYGGEVGLDAVCEALGRLGREIDRNTPTPGWHDALLALTARLLWIVVAFSLASGAVGLLPTLSRVRMQSRYEDGDEPVVTASNARFLDAYGGDAGASFERHEQWLRDRDWIEDRYPLLAHDDELIGSLAEADLLLALAAALSGKSIAPYSHGAYRPELPAERRLRAHARDPRARDSLRRFLALSDEELEPKLTELHRGLRRPGMWAGEFGLFPDVEAQ